MAARLHRIGTIFSRVDGAFRKGLIQKNNLPVWYEVYKRFPPKDEPKYSICNSVIEIPDIFYEEDILRADIHKICSKNQEVINLFNEKQETQTESLLKTCQKYISEGMTKEDALNKIKESVHTTRGRKSYQSIVQGVKEIIPPAKTPT